MSTPRTASQLAHLETLASRADDGFWQGQFRSLRLSSVFQPVVTLSTGQVVGHEGLVRLDYADGRGATPFRFFSGGLDEAGLVDHDIEPDVLAAIGPEDLFVTDLVAFAAEAADRVRADHAYFRADHALGAFRWVDQVFR